MPETIRCKRCGYEGVPAAPIQMVFYWKKSRKHKSNTSMVKGTKTMNIVRCPECCSMHFVPLAQQGRKKVKV